MIHEDIFEETRKNIEQDRDRREVANGYYMQILQQLIDEHRKELLKEKYTRIYGNT